MAWLDNLFGDNDGKLTDKDIGLDLLSSSKAGVGMLSATITETTNPQLRQMLTSQLTAAINSHFQLSDMAIENGWYNAYDTPREQIDEASKDADDITME